MSKQNKKHLNSTPVVLVKPKHKNKNKKQTILTQLKVKGKGGYSLSEIPAMVAKPFVDSTESKGIINKGARFVGKAIGSAIPIPGAGEALGNAASWLARIFGAGKYKIKSNTLLTHNIAQFADNGSIVFSHREYVTDIVSSVNFNNQGYLINPGNPLLFPWLSKIANNFEEFEFLGLIFEFKSMSASAVGSTNTGLGTLIMATDYDVVDANYATKQEMEIADFSTSDAPCYHQYHPVECDPRQNVMKKMFVQNATTLAGYPDDPRFSVLGNFQIATQGVQSASTVGELWVSYHVKLSKPQLARGLVSQPASHVKMHSVNSGSQVIDSTTLYPNNGGLSFNFDTSGGIKVICNNTLGIGSYLGFLRSTEITNTGTIANDAPSVGGTGVFLASRFYYGPDAGYTADAISVAKGVSMASYKSLVSNLTIGGISVFIFTLNKITDYVRLPVIHDDGNTVFSDLFLSPYDTVNISKPLGEKALMRKQLDELYQKFASFSPVVSPDSVLETQQNYLTQDESSPEYCTIDNPNLVSNSSNLISRIPGVGAFALQMPGSVRRT